MTRIAVVIPAHNEERTLPDVLDGLVRQEKDGLELDVVVVNDCSRDRTSEIAHAYAAKHAWLRALDNESNLGLSKTLARGIRETSGDIVVTMHADIVPHRDDWFKRMADAFADPRVGAVGCVTHARIAGLPFIDRFFLESPPRPMLGNKSDAYRRSVLDELGGFDTTFRVAGEDVDLGARIRAAGYETVFPDGMDVDHLMGWHQMGFRKHLKKEVQYAEVQPRLYKRHGYMTTAVHGLTLALIALTVLTLPVERMLAGPVLAASLGILALMVWLSRKDRAVEAAAFAGAYAFLGAAAALALGLEPAARPATTLLIGITLTWAAWNGARALVKARRMREPAVALAGPFLFVAQDVYRALGFWKGVRGFVRDA